jgi:AcrR family transcriptional regulator
VSSPGVTTVEPSVDGRAARWDDHRRARREELLDGVIAAVRTHGADVGMDRIAAAGGTSKAVFYRYFTDKHDLNRCVGRRLAADVVGGIRAAVSAETDDRTMLIAGVDAYLDLLERDPQLYRFVVHHHRVDVVGSDGGTDGDDADYTSMVDDLIVGIFSTRLGRLELDTAAARPWGVAVVGAVRAVGDWWLAHPEVPRREVSDYLTALLWNGMAGAHLPAARPV